MSEFVGTDYSPSQLIVAWIDYDTFFMNDSRFTTADLPTKRLTVFLEASWGKPVRDTHNHDFEGMNTNAIKAIVADGLFSDRVGGSLAF